MLRRSVAALVDQALLELRRRVKVALVGGVQCARADDLRELADLPGPGQGGQQLGGHLEVVVAGAARTGAAAHQPRQ